MVLLHKTCRCSNQEAKIKDLTATIEKSTRELQSRDKELHQCSRDLEQRNHDLAQLQNQLANSKVGKGPFCHSADDMLIPPLPGHSRATRKNDLSLLA